MKCNICPRKCGVDRKKQIGFCGEGDKIRIAKIMNNFMWEEPPISGEKGTCAVFFSGCSLKCSFCQNYEISRGKVGKQYSINEFVDLLKQIDNSDNETIDFITPTHFSNQILQALKKYKPKKKIVWNSSGYESLETIIKIAPYIDIFLPDFKYFDPFLSKHFSKAEDYFDKASNCIVKMTELKKNKYSNERLVQGVIIRHLVLPGNAKDSFAILDYIKKEIKDPIISLMSQFTPSGEKRDGQKLYMLEYKAVLSHARKIGLEKGFIQDINSANELFIPNFSQ